MIDQEIHNPILRLIEQYPATSSIVSAFVFFILGLLLESKFKFTNKTKIILGMKNSIVDKSNDKQEQSINKSPESLSGNAGEDMLGANGRNSMAVSIKDSPGASVLVGKEVGREKDALSNPMLDEIRREMPLEENQLFIFEQIIKRLGNVIIKEDYAMAEAYRCKNCFRPAATLYIRIFTPINESLKKNQNELFSDLNKELENLQSWSLRGESAEKLEDIIGRIEIIMFKFLQA